MTSGYADTPLVKKLGLRPGDRVILFEVPVQYPELIGEVLDQVIITDFEGEKADFIHLFVKEADVLASLFPLAKTSLTKTGGLWISWPKKTSKVKTDLKGNVVREIGLCEGLVDVKVCAVDEVWSGLKFMYRKTDR